MVFNKDILVFFKILSMKRLWIKPMQILFRNITNFLIKNFLKSSMKMNNKNLNKKVGNGFI